MYSSANRTSEILQPHQSMSVDNEVQWHTLLSCILPAILTVATQPSGSVNFFDDLKKNLLYLTPLSSGSRVAVSFLRLISWKILNASDLGVCLWLVSGIHFNESKRGTQPPTLNRSRGYFLARWIFFAVVTIPQYSRLLAFQGILWTQIWATCLIVHFLAQELLAYHFESTRKVTLRAGWPAKSFMVFSTVGASTTATATETTTKTANHEIDNPILENLPRQMNTCEAVKLFILPLVDDKSGTATSAQQAGFWKAMGNHAPVWSCGHMRCLLYKVSFIPAHCLPDIRDIFTCLLFIWLLHSDLRWVTTYVATGILGFPMVNSLVEKVWSFVTVLFYVYTPPFTVVIIIICASNIPIRGGKFLTLILRHPRIWKIFVGFITIPTTIIGFYLWATIEHVKPTPKGIAWIFEGILCPIVAILAYWLSSLVLGIKSEDLEKKTRAAPDEESHPELFSLVKEKGKEQLGEPALPRVGEIDNDDLADEIIVHAIFLLCLPATLFWYIFCYQSAGTIESHWSVMFPFGLSRIG